MKTAVPLRVKVIGGILAVLAAAGIYAQVAKHDAPDTGVKSSCVIQAELQGASEAEARASCGE